MANTSQQSEKKNVLMVVRSFPPFLPVGHSIRAVKFIKYLPALGWQPIVLTVDDQYEYDYLRKVGSESLLSDIQSDVKIYRTTAAEPSLEFLEKERKFGQLNWLTKIIVKLFGGTRRWIFRNIFLPDRYLGWLPYAVGKGLQIIKREGIDVIFATCPPYSDMLIGACLKQLTGKPLILDFRDDWIDTPFFHSRSKIKQMIERRMESWVVKTANKVILVTEWSKKAFQERYPGEPSDKFVFIPNGCDLEDFAVLDSIPAASHNPMFTILHAGTLNDSKSFTRSPVALFQAIQNILKQQPDLVEKIRIAFTGSLQEGHKLLVEDLGITSVVKELGFVPRDEFMHLMNESGMLLVINYEGFSTLIPGKIYEYWAIGNPPILFLSCPGVAQELIEKRGLGITVLPDDVSAIEQAILTVYHRYESGTPIKISREGIEDFDRKTLSKRLVQTLDSVVSL